MVSRLSIRRSRNRHARLLVVTGHCVDADVAHPVAAAAPARLLARRGYAGGHPPTSSLLEAVRGQDDTEAVSGVGDEAYFHNNSDRYAELYVKVGERVLTLQASGEGTIESLKPNVLGLAKALIDKMG